MAKMKLNERGLSHARSLFRDGKVVHDSDWSEAKPSTDKENEVLENQGRGEYEKWFLGYDPDEDKDNKGYFGFPYGDFSRVHRDALTSAKQRAGQNDYSDIEDAADDLLDMIDKGYD